jgi:cyclopropane-fatty-acyl-phospholipid synthase
MRRNRQRDYWRREWASRSSGGHRRADEDFLKMEADEKLFHAGRGGSLLDFGCGAAELTVHYATAFKKVIGADFSETMLAAARRRAADGGVHIEFALADDETVWSRVEGNFDVITSSQVVQFLSRQQLDAFIAVALTRLNDGGCVLLFDIIHPTAHLMARLGLLDSGQSGRGISLNKIAIEVKRLLRLSVGRPGDITGYAQRPAELLALAKKHNATATIVWSMYYEYRYHAILTPVRRAARDS